MDLVLLISVVSGLAISNSLFFGFYLLSVRKKSISNMYLAFLLFALAIRIGKSVIVVAIPNAPEIFPALGLVGMAAIGPFVLLYIRSLTGYTWLNSYMFHFLPSLALVVLIPFSSEEMIYAYYQFAVAQLFVYMILSVYRFKRYRKVGSKNEPKNRWIVGLLSSVGIIWLVFFIQLVWDYYLSYFVATTTAALALYILSFWAMRRQKVLFRNGRTVQNSVELGQLSSLIRAHFEEEKAYLDFDITIQKVARQLMVQPYLVSQVINDEFQKSFPELVNEYRVLEVKQKLSDASNDHLSIESIAYDSGFVTPSAFYSTFRRFTGKTPNQFRKRSA